jgi:hypothetical protein
VGLLLGWLTAEQEMSDLASAASSVASKTPATTAYARRPSTYTMPRSTTAHLNLRRRRNRPPLRATRITHRCPLPPLQRCFLPKELSIRTRLSPRAG